MYIGQAFDRLDRIPLPSKGEHFNAYNWKTKSSLRSRVVLFDFLANLNLLNESVIRNMTMTHSASFAS